MRVVYGLIQAVIILLFAVAATAGEEVRWVSVGQEKRTSYLLDMKSVASAGTSLRTCLVKRIFAQQDKDMAFAQDSLEIDCSQNFYRYINIVIFDSDGLVSHRYALTDQSCPIPTLSHLHKIRELICAASRP